MAITTAPSSAPNQSNDAASGPSERSSPTGPRADVAFEAVGYRPRMPLAAPAAMEGRLWSRLRQDRVTK